MQDNAVRPIQPVSFQGRMFFAVDVPVVGCLHSFFDPPKDLGFPRVFYGFMDFSMVAFMAF